MYPRQISVLELLLFWNFNILLESGCLIPWYHAYNTVEC